MKVSITIFFILLLVSIFWAGPCHAQVHFGGDGDGSSSAGTSVMPINDQGPYLSGGSADGSAQSAYVGALTDHTLYCSGGPADGSSYASGVFLINGNLIYCMGGSGDGFSGATLLASINNQVFYCAGGSGDGISNALFAGPMVEPIAFFGGAGDGQAGVSTGLLYLNRGLWTGLVSDDWNDPGNWNGLALPDAGTDVDIPAEPKGTYFPYKNSGTMAQTKDLTVHPGASLTVPTGNSLGVNQDLLIRSDETGMGSVIDHGMLTVTGTSTVDLYLTPDAWHYVSSPVGWAQSGVFTGHYLYNFVEASDSWNNIVPEDVSLGTMQGYAAWVMDNPATIHFEGPLHTGQHDIVVTRNSTLTDQGWNLVGNPYPSAVDWDAEGGWVKENVDNTIYFYQGAGGLQNYRYYIGESGETPEVGVNGGSNEIPPMQGFFVHASGQGLLSVNHSARIHSGQPYYKKSSEITVPMVRLRVIYGNLADETVIRFVEGAGMNHDGQFDAFKMFSTDLPQVYAVTADKTELAVSTLPPFNGSTLVPLGFAATQAGEYNLEMTEMIGLDEVWLEDLQTGAIHRLTDDPAYTFNGGPQDENARFLLHFGMPETGQEDQTGMVEIYAHGQAVFIRNKTQGTGEAWIFSVPGRRIVSGAPVIQGLNRLPLLSETGFYIVKVVTGQSITTQKVFIKN